MNEQVRGSEPRRTTNLRGGWSTSTKVLNGMSTAGQGTRVINEADVLIIDNTAILTWDTPLKTGTVYHVTVDPTAIIDAVGNAFAGIADTTTLSFTTAA